VYPFSLRGSTLVWPKCPFIKKFWGIWTLKFHSLYAMVQRFSAAATKGHGRAASAAASTAVVLELGGAAGPEGSDGGNRQLYLTPPGLFQVSTRTGGGSGNGSASLTVGFRSLPSGSSGSGTPRA